MESKEIIIKGTFEEELTSEDYDMIFQVLMERGIKNIEIKEEEKYDQCIGG